MQVFDSSGSIASNAGSASLAERMMGMVARNSHFVMAALVTCVVATMVLPVPPVVLNVLIAFNISISVLLLMLSIYIPSALGMSTFPTLIVLTTVMRLSLNIASTKQILLHAHAGSIIETFGRLVMGGSVVVGLVVFSIIAVVQFIVISKGAERVAEVGARFTLDALPGKQMSIEADLRGGFIDKQEARRQRQVLAQESHMHGSMDGAMKFVKGDAIASILIALVNIIGGVSIGVGMLGMTMGDAMARYTLLSIGDGMVSQIPSLLTSIAAGVLITRVAGQEDRPRNLAGQIGRQVVDQPMALLASSGIMLAFLLVPGFPKVPFVLLALLFFVLGWRARNRQRAVPSFEPVAPQDRAGGVGANALVSLEESTIVAPLLLHIAENLRDRLSPVALQQALEHEKSQLQHDLGLVFPALQVRFNADLPDDAFVIDVQEVPAQRGDLPADLSVAEAELARRVALVVRMRPDAFVGTQEINELVKRSQAKLPDLHDEVMRTMPMQRVSEVLRRLALEGVSLRYLREIYESMLTWAAREKDTAMLCEYVRIDLGRFICQKFLDERRSLRVLTLDASTETQLRSHVQQGVNGAYLAMPPEASRELLASVKTAVSRLPSGVVPVLLTTVETRRFLRRLLVQAMPQLHVLSYPELPADIQIQPLGRIVLPRRAALRVAGA